MRIDLVQLEAESTNSGVPSAQVPKAPDRDAFDECEKKRKWPERQPGRVRQMNTGGLERVE